MQPAHVPLAPKAVADSSATRARKPASMRRMPREDPLTCPPSVMPKLQKLGKGADQEPSDCANFETGPQRLDWPNWISVLWRLADGGSGHALPQLRYRRGNLGLGPGEGPDCCLLRVRAATAAGARSSRFPAGAASLRALRPLHASGRHRCGLSLRGNLDSTAGNVLAV